MASYPSILEDILKFEDDSDEDFEMLERVIVEEKQLASRKTRHCGSVHGHIIINRQRVQGHEQLYRDYFATYPDYIFRRRFRMRRHVFCRIQSAVEANNQYFVQKPDALGVPGLSSLQKMTAALRMLAYGAPADFMNDYVRIGKSTTMESLRMFVKSIVEVFGNTYLRSPNNNDIHRLLAMDEERGFPGLLGSIDCMHWAWKNCPTAWQGQYKGHCHEPTIFLEAVASKDLWIWHAFFGLPGSLNDINVLDRSPVFAAIAEGRAPPVNYTINGHDYTIGYYLADGIYPKWSTLVKTIPAPQGLKRQHFAKQQEATRKDVERAFGVLQLRFAIVCGPARIWDEPTLANIMKACIIMHNMIIEDEGDTTDNEFDGVDPSARIDVSFQRTPELLEFIQNHHNIRNTEIHCQLQLDLIEHLWEGHGQE